MPTSFLGPSLLVHIWRASAAIHGPEWTVPIQRFGANRPHHWYWGRCISLHQKQTTRPSMLSLLVLGREKEGGGIELAKTNLPSTFALWLPIARRFRPHFFSCTCRRCARAFFLFFFFFLLKIYKFGCVSRRANPCIPPAAVPEGDREAAPPPNFGDFVLFRTLGRVSIYLFKARGYTVVAWFFLIIDIIQGTTI